MAYQKASVLVLKTFSLLAATLVINTQCQVIPNKFNISSDDVVIQIANGKRTDISSVPWQAAIRWRNSQTVFCGATIIDRFYVLTAAHCLIEKSPKTQKYVPLDPADLYIIVGADNLQTSYNLIQAPVATYETHPMYNPYTAINDIAVIKTNIDLTRGNRFKPKHLPQIRLASPSDTTVYKSALVSGFGGLSAKGPSNGFLLFSAIIKIVPDALCQKVYSNYVGDKMICTLDNYHNHNYKFSDVCIGDSGGPFVVKSPQGDHVLAGVTSYGSNHGCGKGYPAVFTRVSYYKEWVEGVIGKRVP